MAQQDNDEVVLSTPGRLRDSFGDLRGPLYFVLSTVIFPIVARVGFGYSVYGALWASPLVGLLVVAGNLYFTHQLCQVGRFPASFVPNMTGKRVIVTGGNNGIGYREAVSMARWGAEVTIACRNAENGEAARRNILRELGVDENSTRVRFIQLDLASQASVRKFAGEWKTQNHDGRLDVLCNNAGIMFTPFGTTKEGLELQFGTNQIGHFLLANLLTPNLQEAKGRIVCVSSAGHRFCRENIDYAYIKNPVEPYDRRIAYGWAKASNILHARELNKRLSASGVTAYSVHPGIVNTNLGSGMASDFWVKVFNWTVMWLLMKEPQVGADAVLFCCVHPDAQPGRYHRDCRVAPTQTQITVSDAEARRLWLESESMIKA